MLWGAVVTLFTIPLFGILGDYVSKRFIFVAGAMGIVIFSGPFFSMLGERTTWHINLAMVIGFGLVYAAMYAQEASLFSSMFPAGVRYTGISLAVQIGGAIGGGTAPLVATYLLKAGNGDPKLIVAYMATLGVIAVACGLCMRPYHLPDGSEPISSDQSPKTSMNSSVLR